MPENLKSMFSGIAENYEKFYAPVLFIPTAKDIVSRITGKPESILEIAAGTGQVTRLLKEKNPNARIVSSDINSDMLAVAKSIAGEKQIEWAVVNAEEIPFDESTFDVVVCQFGIMFVPDKQKAVNEAYRVLKTGGSFIFSTWDKVENQRIAQLANEVITSYFKDDPPQFFSIPFSMNNPAEMETLMRNAGFKDISVKNVTLEGFSASAEDAAKGFTLGNPVYAQICERDDSAVPEILKTMAEVFRKEFGSSSLCIPLSEFVAEGIK
jgi:ubiquinone/menaquinone biosynthesis C-methylase UbiE